LGQPKNDSQDEVEKTQDSQDEVEKTQHKITWKNAIASTLYELVYGNQALLPIEFHIKTFKIVAELGLNLS